MTDEELDKEWALLQKYQAERDAKYNALPEEEKKRIEEELSDPFYARISDNPFGNGDNDDSND